MVMGAPFLPKRARRAFRGVLFDVYQWRQRMFDGSYETFERVVRVPSVQIIAERGGKVLLLRERQPGQKGERMSMPGGQAMPGESPLATAKRELLEEAGLAADRWVLLKSYTGMHKVIWHTYLFAAVGCRRSGRPRPDSGERIRQQWVPLDRLIDLYTGRDNLLVDLLKVRYDARRRREFLGKIGLPGL